MSQVRNVAILIFDEVEVLDFCGPFEVFSTTGQRAGAGDFNVYTVSQSGGPVRARNGLRTVPDYSIENAPQPEILLVPGGYGTRREVDNPRLIDWIRRCAEGAELTLSVCTGALLLGQAGLLEGLSATTHHGAFDLLRKYAPGAEVREDVRIVDNGTVVLSGGISAGIDMSLHIVARLLGQAAAEETAEHMEYRWQPEPGMNYARKSAS